jgi:adiponectin receptor
MTGAASEQVSVTTVSVSASSTVAAATRPRRGDQNKSQAVTTVTCCHRREIVWRLLHVKDGVPAHVPDNPYIMSGYRPPLTIAGCLRSMLEWHNQTLNMWTALLLMWLNLLFAAHFADLVPSAYQTAFWVHGTLRALCWMHSWLYHTFVSYPSRNLAGILCTLDYIGCYLTPLGIASNVVFVELHEYATIKAVIIVLGALGIGAAMLLSTLPMYQTEAYRPLRAKLSIACTAPHVAGVVLAIAFVHNWRIPDYYRYLGYAIAWELAGAAVYVSMLPEKVVPHTFDTWLNSHILWHCFNYGFDFYMMYFVYSGALHLGDPAVVGGDAAAASDEHEMERVAALNM